MQNIKKDMYSNQYSLSHRIGSGTASSMHFHDDLEVFFLIGGAGSCLIDDKVLKIKPYDIIIINPNRIHKVIYSSEENYERYVIVAKTEFLESVQENNEITDTLHFCNGYDNAVISPDEEEREELIGLIERYFETEKSSQYAVKTATRARMTDIMIFISNLIHNHGDFKTKITVNTRIEPVLSYINKHFAEEDCTLCKISEKCNMSKNYLCGEFKKHTFLTVNSYVINKKIIYAKELLALGYNVTECAEKAGFSDYSNFIRVFKKYVGKTPKQYQLQNHK